jgi:aryl-alcohol dehydrogenase-like predicted oxidoreductase
MANVRPEARAIDMFDPARRRLIRSLAGAAAGMLAWQAMPAAERAPMLRRAIPRSGETLPVIGLGTSQTYDFDIHDAETRKAAAETLRVFLDAGQTVIDTSPMYGRAEAVLGELLAEVDSRQRAFIATKVWTTGADAGRKQIDDSFRLLRRERIDLIQVHNLVDVDTQLATLQQLKRDGRIRYVGVTASRDPAHADLVKQIERGTLDFVQVNYSLTERAAENTVLPAAAANRVAVLVNRPYSKAGLFDRVKGRPLPAIAAEIGAATWAQFALKWIVSHPAVTCAIPGTNNPQHMLDNIEAGIGALPDAAMRVKMATAFESI